MVDIDISFQDGTVSIDYDTGDEDATVHVLAPSSESVELDSAPPVEEVPLEQIENSPYSVRSFGVENTPVELVEHIREREAMPTFPFARRLDDGRCEILDGNRRFAELKVASLDTAILHTANVSDWTALEYWVEDHFPPATGEVNGDYYDEEDQRSALRKMLDDWDEQRLREIPRLDAALDEHGDAIELE